MSATQKLLRFGVFELNLHTEELRKSGSVLKFPPQSFKLLALLASHAGQVVSRQDIQTRLWPNDPVVDFEHGVNRCINQIRSVLGDHAEHPLYVETLPRQGYRFVAPVVAKTVPDPDPQVVVSESGELGRAPLLAAAAVTTPVTTAAAAARVPQLVTAAEPAHEAASAPAETRPGARRRLLTWLVAALLLLGAALGYFARRGWPSGDKPPHILAVLPIDAVGKDAATTAQGMGLTDTVAGKLAEAAKDNAIKVISPRDLRDQNVRTAKDAVRDFGADLVLESSLQREGPNIRIVSSLVDPRTHRQLAARTITVDANDSFGLQDRVVSEVLDMLPSPTDPEQRRKLMIHRDTQPAAYEAYVRGRGYLLQFNKPEDIDSAVAEFSKAIQIDPKYALAYAALGNTYRDGAQQFNRGNEWIANASQNCSKALSLNPDLVEGHICLGNLYNATGKYDKAVEEFGRAVRADPGNENVLRGLADTYTNIGNFTAAESTYQSAVELRPNHWAPYNWLGAFYFGQNRYADAAAAFQKSTALAPDSYLGYVNLGAAYVYEGRYADAIDALKHSIALRPSNDAYNNLGYALMLTGKTDDAIDCLQKALAIDDRDWMNWGNLGDALYWSSNRRNEAAEKYHKALAIASSKLQVNSNDVLTLAYLANYSAMIGEKEAARRYLEQALKVAPSNGDVLFRAALIYNHFAQSDRALSYLDKAVQAGYSRTVIRDTPDFGNLHDNPHFRALVGALG